MSEWFTQLVRGTFEILTLSGRLDTALTGAGGLGIEPRFRRPERRGLPLADPPIR